MLKEHSHSVDIGAMQHIADKHKVPAQVVGSVHMVCQLFAEAFCRIQERSQTHIHRGISHIVELEVGAGNHQISLINGLFLFLQSLGSPHRFALGKQHRRLPLHPLLEPGLATQTQRMPVLQIQYLYSLVVPIVQIF